MVKTLLSNAGGMGSIPGQGARIPQKHKKWEQYCSKLKTLKIVNIKKKKRIWHKFKSELFPLLEVDLGQVYST